jgi:hypothetical protein
MRGKPWEKRRTEKREEKEERKRRRERKERNGNSEKSKWKETQKKRGVVWSLKTRKKKIVQSQGRNDEEGEIDLKGQSNVRRTVLEKVSGSDLEDERVILEKKFWVRKRGKKSH